jgi:arginase
MTALTVLGVPTSAGAFAPGQERAPAALREAGLLTALGERGVEVRDLGDSTVWRWRPDRERPRAQNLDAVTAIARDTARRVEAALGDGPLLVLGGDCSIELGVLAGHLAQYTSLGLVYLDLHPDLNTPKSVVEGTFDWMGMAHALGVEGAEPELAGIGPRTPLLDDDQLLFLGYGPERARPFELDQIVRRGLAAIPVDAVAADPEAAAGRALDFVSRFDRLLVHFDVDVVDFVDQPLSENTGHNIGLPFDAACAALEALVAGAGFAGLTVTEHNPAHGAEDGSTTKALADALQRALS